MNVKTEPTVGRYIPGVGMTITRKNVAYVTALREEFELPPLVTVDEWVNYMVPDGVLTQRHRTRMEKVLRAKSHDASRGRGPNGEPGSHVTSRRVRSRKAKRRAAEQASEAGRVGISS